MIGSHYLEKVSHFNNLEDFFSSQAEMSLHRFKGPHVRTLVFNTRSVLLKQMFKCS